MAKGYESAADWPTWTDEVRYEPTEAEAAWVAENLSDDHHTDEPTPDDVLDLQADEAIELDRLERGIRFF